MRRDARVLERKAIASLRRATAAFREEADLASYDGTMDLAGRGFGSFDAILGPHTESDEATGLDAAYDWLLATMPVAGRA